MSRERPDEKRSDGRFLAAAAAAVARGDDLDDSLAQLLGLAADHTRARVGAIYILDQDRDELELTVTVGLDADAVGAPIGPLAETDDPLSLAARSRRPLRVDRPTELDLLDRNAVPAGLLLPLVVRRDGIELTLGVLVLGFDGDVPELDPSSPLVAIADLAAVTVERALALSLGSERAEWFERLAHTDPLTGLANRRTLDRMLELELARAGRQAGELSVALFDVDSFEAIERDAGQPAADEVLRKIAQVLSESVRLVDTVARYGGDEFMLVAPGPEGLVVAERLVHAVSGLPAIAGHSLSVSAGLARFPMDGRTAEELIASAEAAAALAATLGGGRVATAGVTRE